MIRIAKHKRLILLFGFILLVNFSCTYEQKQLNEAEFRNPPASVKVHTWWHWLDGNITKEGITCDLEAMKEQGITQATILNVGLFGNRDFGVEKINFNTPEWYEMFRWALKEADRLGISIGAHNCDGWSSSGGPWISPDMSMKQFTWTKTIVNAADDGTIKLAKPFALMNYYEDVAVVAVKSSNPQNSFHKAKPVAMFNDNENIDFVFDGCTSGDLTIKKGDFITFEFKESFTAAKVVFMPRRTFMWSNPAKYSTKYSIAYSDDGKNFNHIREFSVTGLNKMVSVPFEKTSAKFFRLSLVEMDNADKWIPLTLTECEILPENEKPLYSSDIEYLLEKTGSVKAANEKCFYNGPAGSALADKLEVVDITSKMDDDGTLNWKPESGNWTVIRFGYTTTGITNSPATAAGVGLECDKTDTAALNLHFNSFPLKLIEEAGSYAGNTFKFMLIDSWEAGFQNWSKNLPFEFGQRRGYSLTSYIPVLCGESSGNTEADEGFLFDFRKTIAELIENNYYKHFGELLHRFNMEFHAEVIYGNTNYPSLDILKTTQYVDMPMYEFWSSTNQYQNTTYYPSGGAELNMPSYAAVCYEKPILGAEAYTGMAHYSEYPQGLKPFGDKAFCAGINQMILHSYVHQPNDKKPGMTLGQWASHFNRNNTYWPYMAGWLNYQSRIQYVLQKGVASHDVLYYLGDELPQFLLRNESNELPFGYTFNACNYDVLKNRVSVENGKLILNGKTSYAVLSMQPGGKINFETLQLLEELVCEGIILYAPKPADMLLLKDIENNKAAFNKIADSMWGDIDGSSVTSNNYGRGKVFWGIPLSEALEIAKIKPDVFTGQDDAFNLMFIHKKVNNSDVYFIMNQQNSELHREISFRVSGKTPEIWDTENGNVSEPAIFSADSQYTTLPVTLYPYQSLLFVFRNEKPVDFIKQVYQGAKQIFPADDRTVASAVPEVSAENNVFVANSTIKGNFEFITGNNKSYVLNSPGKSEFVVSDYTGGITFVPAYPATIDPVEIDVLDWLTESKNTDVKYFSGVAKYTISFSFPIEEIEAADSVLLDLGDFNSVAGVWLNGENLGKLWRAGTCINVKGILKAGNVLEVEIANTFRNRFIGDFIQYGEVQNLWTSAPVMNFLNKDMPLTPSGLKGPLTIVAVNKQSLK